jgi:V/A-type H+-transporting ATPase subunit I
MRRIDLTILDRDIDPVIEFLGRRALLHITNDGQVEPQARDVEAVRRINELLERIRSAAETLGAALPQEPDDAARLPTEAEAARVEEITRLVAALCERETAAREERRRLEAALNEVQAFDRLSVSAGDFDQLSYLTIRVGRIDAKDRSELERALGDRALIVPLGGENAADGRILAAASRKGRFALDSELKKQNFVPAAIPEGGAAEISEEVLAGLKARIGNLDGDITAIEAEKTRLREEWEKPLVILASDYLIAAQVEHLKEGLRATSTVYVLSGWIRADQLKILAAALEEIAGGRVAIRAWTPEELASAPGGTERVPVSLEHGAFVRGFARLVFSYGAPLYGTIDPTPFVAFSFAVLFGIMFGDVGQGFVLFALGLLTGRRGPRSLAGLRVYSTPLVAVGISSMAMGLLTGEVFTMEGLLAAPTEIAAGLVMRLFRIPGEPPHQILHLMPDSGSIAKLFYFFGFTISAGVALNSIGLVVNITNLCLLKKYEKAFFSKTGAAGLFLFWYAVFIAVRIILGGQFIWVDAVFLAVPALCIFFGPLLWRLVSGERPVLEEGFLVFFMEGFVEVLETASTYISNTVSFLRVGAFALSHAVLSFIVFTLSEMVRSAAAGPLFSVLVMILGNLLIIVLEGMIVAIQVVRLQYYEFFSKFFTETGLEFAPFRFRKGEET